VSSPTRVGAKGRQTTAPIAQDIHVTCSAGRRSKTGFCATTPAAYARAARRHRITPARGAPRRRRETDHHHAGERHRSAHEQRPRESFAQKGGGQDHDQDRPDADEHRGRSGVNAPLGLIEDDVVETEPDQAGDEHEPQVATGWPDPSTAPQQRAQHDAAEHQSPERESAGENVRPAALMPTNAEAQRNTETSAAARGSQARAGDRMGTAAAEASLMRMRGVSRSHSWVAYVHRFPTLCNDT